MHVSAKQGARTSESQDHVNQNVVYTHLRNPGASMHAWRLRDSGGADVSGICTGAGLPHPCQAPHTNVPILKKSLSCRHNISLAAYAVADFSHPSEAMSGKIGRWKRKGLVLVSLSLQVPARKDRESQGS